MTLGNVMSHMGIGTKHAAERYSEYHSSPHDQHLIYTYEPHHVHHSSSKHSHGGGGKKGNAALSALTLLAFLFFLNILQQCLRDHMQTMQANPQIMIMSAGKEGEESIAKISDTNKIDKTGIKSDAVTQKPKSRVKNKNHRQRENVEERTSSLTEVKTAQHIPKMDPQKYKHLYDYSSRNPLVPGVVVNKNK